MDAFSPSDSERKANLFVFSGMFDLHRYFTVMRGCENLTRPLTLEAQPASLTWGLDSDRVC